MVKVVLATRGVIGSGNSAFLHGITTGKGAEKRIRMGGGFNTGHWKVYSLGDNPFDESKYKQIHSFVKFKNEKLYSKVTRFKW